jgi:GNAT superfamily N-acetyltransferase
VEKIDYRLATIDDVETLLALRVEFIAEVIKKSLHDPIWMDAARQYLRTALPSGQLIACLAESTAQIVGTGWLVYQQIVPSPASLSGRDAYILNMYTRPPWRRRGIAREILQKLLDCARQTDCRRVTLHFVATARPLYSGAGFVTTESEMRLDLRLNPK